MSHPTNPAPSPSPASMPPRAPAPTSKPIPASPAKNPHNSRHFLGYTPEQVALREAVDRDLKGRPTPEDLTLLQDPENLFAWYELLGTIAEQASTHIELRTSRLHEKALTLSFAGEDFRSSPEYLRMEIATLDVNRRGRHFLTHVTTKRDSVRDLLAHHGITTLGCAKLIEQLIDVQREVDRGDEINASILLDALIEQLRGAQRLSTTPASTESTPKE